MFSHLAPVPLSLCNGPFLKESFAELDSGLARLMDLFTTFTDVKEIAISMLFLKIMIYLHK